MSRIEQSAKTIPQEDSTSEKFAETEKDFIDTARQFTANEPSHVDGLNTYMRRVRRFPLFTAEQEVLAFEAYGRERTAEKQAEEALFLKLTPRERELAKLRLYRSSEGNKKSQEEITRVLGMKPDETKKIEDDIVDKLQKSDGRRPVLEEIFGTERKTAREKVHALRDLKQDPRFPDEFNDAITLSNSAHDLIANCNLRMVIFFAKRSRHGLTFEDKIQEGWTGLRKAIERFDVQRGFKFSSYAALLIKQSISKAVCESDRIIRLPEHIHELIGMSARLCSSFEEKHTRRPTEEELTNLLIGEDVSKAKASEIANMVMSDVIKIDSLDRTVGDLNDKEKQDFITDPIANTEDQAIAPIQEKQIMDTVSATLSERDFDILQKLLLEGMALENIARIHGLSRESIRQMAIKAKERLKRNPELQAAWYAR